MNKNFILKLSVAIVLTLSSTLSFAIVNPYHLLQSNYLYDDEDIRAVIGGNDVSTAIRFGKGAYNQDYIDAILPVANVVGLADQEHISVPINYSGGHWAALSIQRGSDGVLRAMYNDSGATPMGAELRKILNDLGINNDHIIDLQIRQQYSGVGCGAFTAENLKVMASMDWSNPDNINALRTRLAAITDDRALRRLHFRMLYQGANAEIESLKPEAEEIASDATEQTQHFMNNIVNINNLVDGRIASLQRVSSASGMAAGDESLSHGVWIKAFGGAGSDRGSFDIGGVKVLTESTSSMYGLILGADTKLNEDSMIGISFTNSNISNTKTQKSIVTKTNLSSNIFSIYGSNKITDKIFLNTSISYGEINAKTTDINTSSYKQKGDIFGASWLANYDIYSTGIITITPRLGVAYKHLNQSGHNTDVVKIAKRTQQELDLKTGIMASAVYDIQSLSLVPYISADYIRTVWSKGSKIQVTSMQDELIPTSKISSNKNTFKLGGGLSVEIEEKEIGAGYEYISQGASQTNIGYIKLRLNF